MNTTRLVTVLVCRRGCRRKASSRGPKATRATLRSGITRPAPRFERKRLTIGISNPKLQQEIPARKQPPLHKQPLALARNSCFAASLSNPLFRSRAKLKHFVQINLNLRDITTKKREHFPTFPTRMTDHLPSSFAKCKSCPNTCRRLLTHASTRCLEGGWSPQPSPCGSSSRAHLIARSSAPQQQ